MALSPALLLVAAQAASLGATGPSATIEGRVDVRLDLPGAPRPRPRVAALGRPAAPGIPDRSRSVVYLETAPQAAFEPAAPVSARMEQRRETFVPYVLAVRAGTRVEFPNDDETYHNVFSLSKPKRFDLGRYGRGRSRSVVFDRPGIVRVFCDIHSHMSAWVLVFAHGHFAVTDDAGRYRLPRVPPGRYSIAVWTDGSVRERRSLDVPAGGDVRADFVVE